MVLGCSTVAVGHLLIGIVATVLLEAESLVWSGSASTPPDALLFSVFGISAFSVVFGWYVTLPLGITAAALVEWLERRREAAAKVMAAG